MADGLVLLSLIIVSAAFPLVVMLWKRFHGTPFGRALVGLVVAVAFLIPYFAFEIIEIDVAGISVHEISEVVVVLATLAVAINFVRLFEGGRKWK